MNKEKEILSFVEWWETFSYSAFDGLKQDVISAWLARANRQELVNCVLEMAEVLAWYSTHNRILEDGMDGEAKYQCNNIH